MIEILLSDIGVDTCQPPPVYYSIASLAICLCICPEFSECRYSRIRCPVYLLASCMVAYISIRPDPLYGQPFLRLPICSVHIGAADLCHRRAQLLMPRTLPAAVDTKTIIVIRRYDGIATSGAILTHIYLASAILIRLRTRNDAHAIPPPFPIYRSLCRNPDAAFMCLFAFIAGGYKGQLLSHSRSLYRIMH